MENTIYYTVSTIAQVLATIIGIIGAFAIFRFQSSNERLFGLAYTFYQQGLRKELVNDSNYSLLFKHLQQALNFKKITEIDLLMTKIETLLEETIVKIEIDFYATDILELKIIHQRFMQLSTGLDIRKKALNRILIFAISIIIASIIVLSLTTLICAISAIVLLGIFIIAASLCFFYIYKFMNETILKL